MFTALRRRKCREVTRSWQLRECSSCDRPPRTASSGHTIHSWLTDTMAIHSGSVWSKTHSSARVSLRCKLRCEQLCEQLCDQLCASAFWQKRRHCPPATLRSRTRRRSIQSLRLTPLGLYRPPGLLERSSRHWNRCAFLCWEGNICGCVFVFLCFYAGCPPLLVCVFGVYFMCVCVFISSRGALAPARLYGFVPEVWFLFFLLISSIRMVGYRRYACLRGRMFPRITAKRDACK